MADEHTPSTVDSVVNEDLLPFDFDKEIPRYIQKRDEAGIMPRSLGVVFRNLRVVGLGAIASYQPTLGSILNPLNIVGKIKNVRHPPIRDILSGFEGVVRPGEMILVLGRPGSGCTTLLKTLANQRKEFYSVEGDVRYDSLSPQEMSANFRGDIRYCPEDDIHFPTLTVDQTLTFAAASRTPLQRLGATRQQFAHVLTQTLLAVFGLRHAKNTPIGDAIIRGVSGGEKKRVSITEALASRSPIGVWDNSTRGLDSSTALEYVRALRLATDTFNLTTIVSFYQAGESLYKHFNKVCVIHEGRMVYFGPADKARQYFIDMGYEPANRQTTADFLVAVTDPNGRIPRAGISTQPRSSTEFADYFLKSNIGAQNRQEVDSYVAEFVGKPALAEAYKESAQAEFEGANRMKSPYLLSIPQQVRALMKRRVQIIRGNPLVTFIRLFANVFQALIMGSVFLKMPEDTANFYSRGGILFFSLLFSALTALAEIPALYSQRLIVVRHEQAALYHPFVEALALTLVDIPPTLFIVIVFTIVLYFMTGLQRTPGQFFVFLLFLFSEAVTMKSYFRALAAACKTQDAAQGIGGISVLVLAIYAGYIIPKPSMIGALRWLNYINPLRYGFEALFTNEFHTIRGKCSSLVPQGPGYPNVSIENQVCTVVGSQPGQLYVDGNLFAGLSHEYYWSNAWRNFGIVITFGIGFTLALLVFTEYNTSSAFASPVILFKQGSGANKLSTPSDEESVNEKISDTTDEDEKPHKTTINSSPTADVFTWQHINYTVPIPGNEVRQLLSDVSGYVAPGKLTALMGESGAGKTTLLNVLAQRVDVGVVTGDKFVNGQALPADFQSQSGYCQQMDTHVPTATVREALLFSANLRQPKSVPLSEKEAYVEECLKMCGLERYANASVGSLSTEHKKRTTIGVELAAKPKLLLFLDEPTSGLDSQSAWAIILFLRKLADSGQAILCTIHQPSAELFQVFDRMLLLQKGGRTVYFGDLGTNAITLIDYFERQGARRCKADENPAEYMLDVIGAGATATSGENWHELWQASIESKRVQQEIETIHIEGRSRPAVEASIRTEFATPWLYQTTQLLKRDAQAHWRNPTYLMAKLILNTVGGLFIGFTFFHSKDSQQGTQNKLFSIFMATILSVPLSNQLQVPFIAMRTVYETRERPSRMYGWTALVTSQVFAAIPWNICGSTLLFLTWFWTVGYESSRAGYTYLMLGVIFPLYYTTIGQAIAAMSPSAEVAALLFSVLFSFVIIFNGVLQPFSNLGWWRWMHRLSPYTYLIEGLMGQAIGHQQVQCSAVELVTITPPSGLTCGQYMNRFISVAGGYLTNPDASSSCEFCGIHTTDQLLGRVFDISYNHHWRNVGIMIAFFFFNFACVYLFTYIFRIRRGKLLPSRSSKKP